MASLGGREVRTGHDGRGVPDEADQHGHARATDYFLEAIAADLTYASAREATRDTPELSRR